MYKKISKCRICGNTELASVVDLGMHALTGVFPKNAQEKLTTGPLELVKCMGSPDRHCGLVQLQHSYEASELYGEHYGYRSGLNQTMVSHLQQKMNKIIALVQLNKNDVVVDIGSNDGTLLQMYPDDSLKVIGVDPAADKFKKYYRNDILLVSEYFPSRSLKKLLKKRKAKVITSIAMFYDLENPLQFMQEVYEILDDEGVWIFEQSYLPSMMAANSYDTICHEHIEYYGLQQIKFMTDKIGLKIIDVEFNTINGGSFSVTAAKKEASHNEHTELVNRILLQEHGLLNLAPFVRFRNNIEQHRDELRQFFEIIKQEGKLVLGYGASTKGNVILQYCDIKACDMPYIAEVNEDKYGCLTPGTHIPIISESEAKKMAPDYFFVLPWHFRENIVQREEDYLTKGHALIFPLPKIEIITGKMARERSDAPISLKT